jgi:hypothetical protein
MLFIEFFQFYNIFHEGNLTDVIMYTQQSHISKRKSIS